MSESVPALGAGTVPEGQQVEIAGPAINGAPLHAIDQDYWAAELARQAEEDRKRNELTLARQKPYDDAAAAQNAKYIAEGNEYWINAENVSNGAPSVNVFATGASFGGQAMPYTAPAIADNFVAGTNIPGTPTAPSTIAPATVAPSAPAAGPATTGQTKPAALPPDVMPLVLAAVAAGLTVLVLKK
ncbi:MAG: hypothetical protein NDJ19_00645 [Ramlibacter sp.]|nr:hypothetical protein [Ramlibacter sp.]